MAPVLAGNANLQAAFGPTASFFALEQLGGGHSTAGSTSQVASASVRFVADLTQLAVAQDLVLGLFDPVVSGNGFTDLLFDLRLQGNAVLHQHFTDVSAAETYFTDHAIDFGPIGFPSSTLAVELDLQVTTAAAGDGFAFGALVADPPPALGALMSSAAAFAAPSSGFTSPTSPSPTGDGLPLFTLAPPQ